MEKHSFYFGRPESSQDFFKDSVPNRVIQQPKRLTTLQVIRKQNLITSMTRAVASQERHEIKSFLHSAHYGIEAKAMMANLIRNNVAFLYQRARYSFLISRKRIRDIYMSKNIRSRKGGLAQSFSDSPAVQSFWQIFHFRPLLYSSIHRLILLPNVLLI